MGIDKFYRRGVFPAISVGGLEFESGAYPIAGKTYYVSKQGNDSNGLNWKNAFTTLVAAIAVSNIYVDTHLNVWNRIYVDGGNYTESLVIFPKHCEMIGVGVPSDGPRVNASTVLTTAVDCCHIYNMQFRTSTAAPIVKIPAGSAGAWFVNCIFSCVSGIQPTIGLEIGNFGAYNKIINCKFQGNPSTTTGIQFDGQNSPFNDIIGNFISAITTGILFASDNGASYSDYQTYIKENVICRTDPNSSSQLVIGIDIQDTQSRSDLMTIRNYIAAATAIHDAGTKNVNNHIANEVVEATVANKETKYS